MIYIIMVPVPYLFADLIYQTVLLYAAVVESNRIVIISFFIFQSPLDFSFIKNMLRRGNMYMKNSHAVKKVEPT